MYLIKLNTYLAQFGEFLLKLNLNKNSLGLVFLIIEIGKHTPIGHIEKFHGGKLLARNYNF